MDPLVAEILGSVARWGLSLVVGWLVAHHALPADQSGAVMAHYLPLLTGKLALGLGMAAPLVWSVWQKVRSRVHLNTALEMPAGSTVQQLKRVIGAGDAASAIARTLVLLLIVGGGVATLSACAPKTWKPQTQQVFNQKSVVEGLTDLQHVAIELGDRDVISVNDAGFVVAGVQALLDGRDAGAVGWPDTVRATLTALIGDPDAKPKPIPARLGGAAIDKLAPKIRAILPLLELVGGAQ